VEQGWSRPVRGDRNYAAVLARKLKNVRYRLKGYSKNLSQLSLTIKLCNKVICFLDSLEECRVLFTPEWNLRVIVKSQLETLLHYKSVYWKKRFTLNRIKYGHECTKFFHAMETVNYRRNAITQFKDDNGNMVEDHEGKDALLYNAYKK
jgi:hypothetical protein